MERIGLSEIEAIINVICRKEVTLSGYYKNPLGGPSVQAFEEALAEYHDLSYAVCVSNGTAALHLALIALGVKPGDEVITTPLTFSATATSILMCGAKPVFVDVDLNTYNIDPEKVAEAITENTKAILPVHLLGMPCDMYALGEIAIEHEIPLLEDNAQGLGATLNNHKTGTFGTMSTLSFQETKTITSGGEGGAILTNNYNFADICRKLRNHGQQYASSPYLCWNLRMTELQAAFGKAQLEKLDEFTRLQVNNARRLIHRIFDEDMTGIIPPSSPGTFYQPNLYLIGCLTKEGFPREEFVGHLTRFKVNKNLPGDTIGLGYTQTIMDLPLLLPYKTECPVAESLVKKFLWFDCHRWKTYTEMERIIDWIVQAYYEIRGWDE